MSGIEILVLSILALFFVYGVVSFIAAPIILSKFYQSRDFTPFDEDAEHTPSASLLLAPMVTRKPYAGQYRGHNLVHAKYRLKKNSWLTFSKIKRKQLQERWSVTRLTTELALPEFLLLPKTDSGTVMLMLHEQGVSLDKDDELEIRYFLRTEHARSVAPLVMGPLKDFLMNGGLAYIEVVEGSVIIKKSWPGEKLEQNLEAEFNAAILVIEQLAAAT